MKAFHWRGSNGALFSVAFFIFLSALSWSAYAQLSTTTGHDIYLCTPKSVRLITTPSGGTPPYTYSWTPAATLSNSSVANPVATPAGTTTYIVTVTDNGAVNTVTDSVTVFIGNYPPAIEVLPARDTICDGDTIQLNVFNTASCDLTGSECTTTSSTATIGTGTLQSNSIVINPFFVTQPVINPTRSNKRQLIYKLSELKAAGLEKKGNINSIAFFTNAFTSTWVYQNFTIRMGCTPDTGFATFVWKTGLKTVLEPKTVSIPLGAGWTDFAFDHAFNWDGESSIVVEICFSNPADIGFNGPIVQYANVGEPIANYRVGTTSVCGFTSGTNISTFRPHARFNYCQVSHHAPLTFVWSPVTGLSAANIHNPDAFPVVNTTYILTASDSNGCSVQDSAVIRVASDFNLVVHPDTGICNPDSFPLIAVDNAGPGTTYQWKPTSVIGNPTLKNTEGFVGSLTEFILAVTSAGGCTKTDTFMVDVVPPLNLEIESADTTICAGDSLAIRTNTDLITCGTGSPGCDSPTLGSLGTHQVSLFGITVSPFGINGLNHQSQRKQVIIRKAELLSLGITEGIAISDLAIDIATITGTTAFNNFSIKMGCTSLDQFPNVATTAQFQNGLYTVYTPKTTNIVLGWNTFVFDNNFIWDGVSNIIIDFCFVHSSPLNLATDNQSVFGTNVGFPASFFKSGTAVCNDPDGGFISFFRPDLRFNYCNAPPRTDLIYTWTPATGLSDPAIAEPKASPAVTTKYYLTAREPGSICEETDSITITVAPDFNLTASNDTFLCEATNLPVSVAHTSPLPTTFSWEPAALFSNSMSPATTASLTYSEDLIVRVSSAGCIKFDTVKVDILKPVIVSASATRNKLCLGGNTALNSDLTFACGPGSEPCAFPASAKLSSSSTANTNSSAVSPFIAQASSTRRQYLFRKSELANAGMIRSSTINSMSFELIAVGSVNTFENFTIKMTCTQLTQLSSSFVTGAQTVFEPKDYRINAGSNLITFDKPYNWDGESNLIVELCYTNSGTVNPFFVNANVTYGFPGFNATLFKIDNVPVCNATTGTFSNLRPVIDFSYCLYTPTVSYSWTPAATLNNAFIPNPVATPTATTKYYVTITETLHNCDFTDSVEIAVSDYNITPTRDTILCNSLDFQLNVTTNADPPVLYKWFPPTEVSDPVIPNPTVTVDNGTLYVIEITDSSGCVKKDTVIIDFYPDPAISITSDTSICRSDKLNIFVTGGGTYEWTPKKALNNPNIGNPILLYPDTTTTYRVKINDVNGCEHQDSIKVTVFPSPRINLGVDSFYCRGDEPVLDATGDFISYKWHDGSTDPTYRAVPPGTFSVIAIDNYDCSIGDTITLGMFPTPATALKLNYELCENDSLILDAGNPDAEFTWSTGAKTQVITVRNEGSYWVEVFDGVCTGKDSMFVEGLAYPVSELPEKVLFCELELPYGVPVTAGGQEYSYHWSNGKRTGMIEIAEPGMHTVLITNGENCSILDTVIVRLYCEPGIFAPNSFTPNSDNVNDVFRVSTLNIYNFHIQIFDRWGHLRFESNDPDFSWDGNQNGKPLDQDVFIWKITYDERQEDGTFKSKSKTGDVLILR